MKNKKTNRASFPTTCLALLVAFTVGLMPELSSASGGGGTGGGAPKVDTIKFSKSCCDAPTGETLIKAADSDPTAQLFDCRPDGSFGGELQNAGGTVAAGSLTDPDYVVIVSGSGGSIIVSTTPFQT